MVRSQSDRTGPGGSSTQNEIMCSMIEAIVSVFEELATGEHRLTGGDLMACVFMEKRL